MEYSLLNGTMVGSQNEKGDWIYKANPNAPFKQNGTLKKVYHDLPRFSCIAEYEDREVQDYEATLAEAVKDISIKLLSFSR